MATHRLANNWSLYCDDGTFQGSKAASYEKQIQKLGEFCTVEDLWRFCTSVNETIKRLSPEKFNVRVFKNGIKPMWEDPTNRDGGKWVWSGPGDFPSFLSSWQEALTTVMADSAHEEFKDTLCGMVLVGRRNRREVQIWVSNQPSEEQRNRIRNLHQALSLQFKVGKLSFKSHKDTEQLMKMRASAVKTKRPESKSPTIIVDPMSDFAKTESSVEKVEQAVSGKEDMILQPKKEDSAMGS